jgi:hypothetical protein
VKLVVFSQIHWQFCIWNYWKPFKILDSCKMNNVTAVGVLFAYQCWDSVGLIEMIVIEVWNEGWGVWMDTGSPEISLLGCQHLKVIFFVGLGRSFIVLCLLKHYRSLNRAKETDVLNSHPTFFLTYKIILCQNLKAQQLEISVSFPFWFHSFNRTQIK